MAVKSINVWTCDLCGASKKEKTNLKPSGWAEISIENPQCDRSFTDKCVCGSCINMLIRASK